MTKNEAHETAAAVLVLVGMVLFIGAVWWLRGIEVATLTLGAAFMFLGFRRLSSG